MSDGVIAGFGVIVGALGVIVATVSVIYTVHNTKVADLRTELTDYRRRLEACEEIKGRLSEEKLELLERLLKAGV